jgi:hypothetical protein
VTHDVTDALGLGPASAPLFTTGPRTPGSTGSFRVAQAGSFPVVDTATGHVSEIVVAPEVAPKRAPLGSTFTVYTAASRLPDFLGTQLRVRGPGAGDWHRLAAHTRRDSVAYTPVAIGTYTVEARVRNVQTGVVSGWSPFSVFDASRRERSRAA